VVEIFSDHHEWIRMLFFRFANNLADEYWQVAQVNIDKKLTDNNSTAGFRAF